MDVYTKFDLHIHSYASSKTKTGDQSIVANSTIDNIAVLIEKLKENSVNVVAISDHNIFDKALYLALKQQEREVNCINKVLPGVEIDLIIHDRNVHVVCIFDDSLANHEEIIDKYFETKPSYTIDELGALLRKIGLSVVLIAHQKCDYASERPQKTSLSSAGKNEFLRFIGSEFFDALEIQNTKVEGILKSRFYDDHIENVNLVVGSDCHEWSCYPSHHNGITPNDLLFMKALPTFQGLVMAMTDNSRIYSDIEPRKENILPSIQISQDGKAISLPLSSKINVIIGDNSVGKSTIIKYLCSEVERGALDFLQSHGVQIITSPLEKAMFSFSGQGKIREMFESNEEKLPIKQKFKNYFKSVDKGKYSRFIGDILKYYGHIWERNERVLSNLQNIAKNLYIPNCTDLDKYYLSIEPTLVKAENTMIGLVDVFTRLIHEFKNFNDHISHMDKEDVTGLVQIRDSIIKYWRKYYDVNRALESRISLQDAFIYSAQLFNEHISRHSSSDEAALNTYKSELEKGIMSICQDIEFRSERTQNIWDSFKEFSIEPSINQIGKYCFIDKPIKDITITKELVCAFIKGHIIIDKPLEMLTTSEILTSIKGKRLNNQTAENMQQFLIILYNGFIEQYFTTTVEIKKGDDRLNESNSAGINALYYIDILSEVYNRPIFIIDQPEDDVSQSRISSDLISSLKTLAKKAQVIFVTHNPQLVVNLDVDNVIVLKKGEQRIDFYSGALEFKNNDYSIIDLVANTLDGGADVLRKRWKRYAKSRSI